MKKGFACRTCGTRLFKLRREHVNPRGDVFTHRCLQCGRFYGIPAPPRMRDFTQGGEGEGGKKGGEG